MESLIFCKKCKYFKEVCAEMCAPIRYCKHSNTKVYGKDYFSETWTDGYCEKINKNNDCVYFKPEASKWKLFWRV